MDLSQKTAFLSGAHIANTFITNEWKFNLAHNVNNFFCASSTYHSSMNVVCAILIAKRNGKMVEDKRK